MDEIEFVKMYLSMKTPAKKLALAALIGGSVLDDHKKAKAIADAFRDYGREDAETALYLLRKAHEELDPVDDVGLFDTGEKFLNVFFLDPRTPQQKAGETTRRRQEAKEAEWRQQRLDRETAKALARQVLHDPNANPADRLDASRRLEVLK